MSETHKHLEFAFDEIYRCLSASCYYAAVQCSLALIDVCSCLEQSGGRHARAKAGRDFRKWVEDNLTGVLPISAAHLWELRNGIMHQGTTISEDGYRRFALLLPDHSSFFNVVVEDRDGNVTYINSIDKFCDGIVRSVTQWAASADERPFVRDNLPMLFRYRRETLMAPGVLLVGQPFLG